MWSIGEVKRKARASLKGYYWTAFFVTLVGWILGGGSVGGGTSQAAEQGSETALVEPGAAIDPAHVLPVLIGLIVFLAIVALVVFLIRILIVNPMEVGAKRFYAESGERDKNAGFGRLFWAFYSGHYFNIVWILFLRDLSVLFWTLILILPGIYKSLQYAMIPYILAENPDTRRRDVWAVSKDMMRRQKLHLLCLDLSFIGWYLLAAAIISGISFLGLPALGAVLGGVGLLFLLPYMEAASAQVYLKSRERIEGFPFAGFGGSRG